MAQVIVRNLPEEVVEALRARARANGRSLEAELRRILRREAVRASFVGEAPAPYAARPARERRRSTAIRFPDKPPKFRPFEPIKIKGKAASLTLIEDRR